MKMTHLIAFHGHFGGGAGMVLLLIVALVALLIAIWPGKSQTK